MASIPTPGVAMVPGSGFGTDPLNMAAYATMNVASPEDIWQPQYDRANYAAAGAATVSFFTVALGASATLLPGNSASAASKVKTYRDTNLQQPGVIPTKDFLCVGFSVVYIPAQQATTAANTSSIADDKMRLAYGGWLTFQLIDKPYLYLPLHLLGGLGGRYFSDATNVSGVGPVGLNESSPFWLFELPLLLRAYQTFVVTLTFDNSPALVQTFDIQFLMLGYLRRPSQ